AQLPRYFDVLFGAFPAERLMFGSDWPVAEVAVAYGRWVGVVEDYLATKPEIDAVKIMGGTDTEFYGL
ncbi:MAG: amidohydrolase family protein, partial [Bacteroidota bacterium]